MNRFGPLIALAGSLLLCSCASLENYLSPMAAEALFVGVDSIPEEVDFELTAAATASVFVAEARSLSSVSANLVDDAEQVTFGTASQAFELENLGDGLYQVDTSLEPDFSYDVGVTYTLTVIEDGSAHRVAAAAPPPPTLVGAPGDDELHEAGVELNIDLSGQGFENFVAVVGTADTEGNVELTYDSRPRSASEYIDWLEGSDEVGVVVIPGSAFPSPGQVYLLGVAGIDRAPDSAFDGLNPLVSNYASGSLATAAVVTAP